MATSVCGKYYLYGSALRDARAEWHLAFSGSSPLIAAAAFHVAQSVQADDDDDGDRVSPPPRRVHASSQS